MSTSAQFLEFVQLWICLYEVLLDPITPDTITWLWTADGKYSSISAYMAQFHGSHSTFDAEKIWKAHAELKRRLFS